MKLVSAIIKPHKVNDVRTALAEIGVRGLTVTGVRGAGIQKGRTESYRSAMVQTDFNLREKVDVVVEDSAVDRVVSAIVAGARSGDSGRGRIGDGKIFVHDVADAVRIRTGERGAEAIEAQPMAQAGAGRAA